MQITEEDKKKEPYRGEFTPGNPGTDYERLCQSRVLRLRRIGKPRRESRLRTITHEKEKESFCVCVCVYTGYLLRLAKDRK